MEKEYLSSITEQWEQMTSTVLDLRKISANTLQNLLKETYEALRFYCKEELIPKEISRILLEMDGFLYFTSMFENNEVGIDFYLYQVIQKIVDALKRGFFNADYGCDFPKLNMLDAYNKPFVFDFENECIEDLK